MDGLEVLQEIARSLADLVITQQELLMTQQELVKSQRFIAEELREVILGLKSVTRTPSYPYTPVPYTPAYPTYNSYPNSSYRYKWDDVLSENDTLKPVNVSGCNSCPTVVDK